MVLEWLWFLVDVDVFAFQIELDQRGARSWY